MTYVIVLHSYYSIIQLRVINVICNHKTPISITVYPVNINFDRIICLYFILVLS